MRGAPFSKVRPDDFHRVPSSTDSIASDWERWLASHVRRFLLFARERTACEADAEDVLQEALVEAWERTPSGREPDAALVFATIRRRAIDHYRSRVRRMDREQRVAQEEDTIEWFESSLESAETRGLLEQAVRGLPQPQREVITLKIWGGLTFAQVAEVTGSPLNTAASRYRQALDLLRRRLKHLARH